MKKFIYLGLLALGVVLMVAPPVMAQEEKPFTIHGEVRYRGEYDNNTTDFDELACDRTTDRGTDESLLDLGLQELDRRLFVHHLGAVEVWRPGRLA